MTFPLVALVLAVLPATAELSSLTRGELIPAVAVEGQPEQTYALYLPKAFASDRAWPVLIVFDPMARGALAAGLFTTAAEEHGTIVVASNNARNGPVAPLRAAVEALWRETSRRFPIDPRRVYFAGMSGGSGPAWAMGRSFGAGVIACGAPPRPAGESFEGLSFALYALAGNGDFNHDPMQQTALSTLRGGAFVRFEVFDGGHGWAPPEALGRAVAWFEVLAMRAGTRPRDEALVRRVFDASLARAEALEKSQARHAARLYRAMEREFEGLVALDAIAGRSARLESSQEARKADKAERDLCRRQDEGRAQVSALRRAIAAPRSITPTQASGDLAEESWEALAQGDPRKTLLAVLERHASRMRRSPRTPEVLGSQRIWEGARVGFIETAYRDLSEGRMREAVVDFELSVAMNPASAGLRVELAKALCLAKDRKKALSSLREAVRLGFRNAASLRETEELVALKGDGEFEAILESMVAGGM